MATSGKPKPYRREKPLYKLNFEGDEYDGLFVMAKSLPLGEFFELQRLQEKANTDPDAAETIVRRLADVLHDWNLVDDEGEVPCTFDGLKRQDLSFVLTIFGAWMEAVANVPNRSASASNDGATSLEQSLPMDTA